jgi:hypothetical protein
VHLIRRAWQQGFRTTEELLRARLPANKFTREVAMASRTCHTDLTSTEECMTRMERALTTSVSMVLLESAL